MSFIFGIIDFDNKLVNENELKTLSDAVKWEHAIEQTEYFGHIALGFCYNPKRNPKVGFFKNEDLIVLADIRIYNTENLKKSFDFRSPQEAFAKAWILWGALCGNYINGDYAAIVIDRKKNEAHLFRDHIGTRPLTYYFSDNRLLFASHEFGLVKSGLFKPKLSEKKLINLFFRQNGNYGQTAFESVHKIIPGHCQTFSADYNSSTKFWKPESIKKNKTLTFDESVVRLRELIVTATIKRMETRKTGMHVSGGLDSCGVASIVAEHTVNKNLLLGYSYSPEIFDDIVHGVNEKELINEFCTEKKIAIKYLNLEKNGGIKNTLIPEFETQSIEHSIMQQAEKDEIENLFCGWGGDEFVSLSTRGTVNHLFFKLKWGSLLNLVKKEGLISILHRFRTEVLPLLIPFGLLPIYKSGRTDWSILRLLKLSFIWKNWKTIFFYHQKNVFGYGDRTKFALNLLGIYHLPQRMDSWGINAEKYGFEYKYPLLDKDVLEFWFSIPVEYTYQGFHPRLLYKESMKGILMDKIRTRNDKDEAIFLTFWRKERKNDKNYLENIFHTIPKEEQLPFFKPKSLLSVIKQPHSDNLQKNNKAMHQLTLYIKYVTIVKKYIQISSV
ncbi:MAG: asparagine synthase-related protein [Bacteroidales bacterium]|nr:asparagine synthase-related protein [Bacteroidales bacterium]